MAFLSSGKAQGGLRDLEAGQPHPHPWEGDGAVLGTIARHMIHKNIIRRSRHGFTKGKFYLANLPTFCNEGSGLANKGRAEAVVCPDLGKAFDSISHQTILEKLLMCRLG